MSKIVKAREIERLWEEEKKKKGGTHQAKKEEVKKLKAKTQPKKVRKEGPKRDYWEQSDGQEEELEEDLQERDASPLIRRDRTKKLSQ